MKKKLAMTLCCLLAASTIFGCANIAKDEPSSASSSSTIEASVEASTAAEEVTESSDVASSKEESISSTEASSEETSVSTEAASKEESANAESSVSVSDLIDSIEVKYDDSDYCGYYYKEGSDSSCMIISATEQSGIYEVTLYTEDLGLIKAIAAPDDSSDKDTRKSLQFITENNAKQGNIMFNDNNVIIMAMFIDTSGAPQVKIDMVPKKVR